MMIIIMKSDVKDTIKKFSLFAENTPRAPLTVTNWCLFVGFWIIISLFIKVHYYSLLIIIKTFSFVIYVIMWWSLIRVSKNIIWLIVCFSKFTLWGTSNNPCV